MSFFWVEQSLLQNLSIDLDRSCCRNERAGYISAACRKKIDEGGSSMEEEGDG
jgi:hypothetical protein